MVSASNRFSTKNERLVKSRSGTESWSATFAVPTIVKGGRMHTQPACRYKSACTGYQQP